MMHEMRNSNDQPEKWQYLALPGHQNSKIDVNGSEMAESKLPQAL